jgi:hypothetical protein
MFSGHGRPRDFGLSCRSKVPACGSRVGRHGRIRVDERDVLSCRFRRKPRSSPRVINIGRVVTSWARVVDGKNPLGVSESFQQIGSTFDEGEGIKSAY